MSDTSTKPFLDVTVTSLLAAIGTVAGAFYLLKPKFEITARMKEETGKVEAGFWLLYSGPQLLNALLAGVLGFALAAALVQSLLPSFLANFVPVQFLTRFLTLQQVPWLLLAAGILTVYLRFNVLSWLLLGVTWLTSMLPLPGVRGLWGPKGRSAGWIQAFWICRRMDSGQPLLLSRAEIDRLAGEVLIKLSKPESSRPDFAAKPEGLSRHATGNLALFGCILEASHGAYRWPRPAWSAFYEALSDIHSATKIFEPERLLEFPSGGAFATELREALIREMSDVEPTVVDHRYLSAADDIATTWDILRNHGGSMIGLIPWWSFLFGGQMFWLDRRLAKLPRLDSDGMRPQLIKLLLRWQALPWSQKPTIFAQPFSKGQAWLLLDEGAMRTFKDQKEVTFNGGGDVALSKIACTRLATLVVGRVIAGQSAEAKQIATRHKTRWDQMAAADFVLWSWARERTQVGQEKKWDPKEGFHWKLDAGRAVKVT